MTDTPQPDELLPEDLLQLSARVGALLSARGATLAVAESCTSGLVAAAVTEVPGASAYFLGGALVYANAEKVRAAGVDGELIARHGAVSEPVARALAEGIRAATGADWGLSVTGVAGPGGGTERKPVGTVWVAAAWQGGVVARRHDFGTRPRRQIRAASVCAVLLLLEELLAAG